MGQVTETEIASGARRYDITKDDLPLSCPMPNQILWNAHPRVYLPVEDTGKATCPYCGATYFLSDTENH